MLFTKKILKNIDDFHKYNIGDRVVIKYDGNNIVATIKNFFIYFDGKGEMRIPPYQYGNSDPKYYFNEFEGWIDERNILEKIK